MINVSAQKSEALVNRALPPKTAGWPLVGSLPQLLKDPFGFMMETREEHGDVYRLDLGLSNVVVLNHPRHGQHILRDKAPNYRKGGPLWDAVRDLLGNGLVASEGQVWLRQRRLMQPQFHRKHIAGLTQLMVEAIDDVLSEWEQMDTAVPFDITTGFNHITMTVIVKTLFGQGLSKDEMNEVAEAMTISLDYIMQGTVTHPFPDWMPLPGKAKFKKALQTFDEKVYRIIDQCRRGEGEENHLLAMLLNVVDAETGEAMTDKQLRDEVATLFLAGYETTSIVLSWATHYMLENPEIFAKVRAEVEEAIGDRLPTMHDVANLPYTKQVFQESMRIRPPSFWLPRTAVEDDEIDGYFIPAGTNVVSLNYMYQHHPDVWDEPEKFDPDRFLPERVKERHSFAFLPFGAGQRMCIGKDFALIEGQLALAMMAQRFDIEAMPGHEVVPQLSSTLRPKNGIKVFLKKR